ncbi:MAG: hypothetical protein A2X64_00375 [Ignavibacteria bacterium GWF2_33_9]|nr:MAG: hypothetical protein A2X64_00375 [Ignavibacteria bacterium GWF2_33_9]
MIVSIKEAEYLKNYKIRIVFSDDKVNIVDFADFLKHAKNPMTKKYLDQNLFKNFILANGDIIWNNFELCFPIWDLYTNNIN